MRQSQSAVMERGVKLVDVHETEPFEVAWAGEARWFVQYLRPAQGTQVETRVQISPDGIAWLDHDGMDAFVSEAIGLHSLPVAHFGHWLRLRCEKIAGDEAPLVRIYLELKE